MYHLSESHLVAQACVTRCEVFFTTNYFTILVPVCKQCTVLGDVIYSVACAAICTFIAPPACKGDLERWIQRSFSRTHENKTVASKFRRKPWISLHPLTKKIKIQSSRCDFLSIQDLQQHRNIQTSRSANCVYEPNSNKILDHLLKKTKTKKNSDEMQMAWDVAQIPKTLHHCIWGFIWLL